MWLEAVDLVLHRLRDSQTPFHRIKGISGAGQQHGSVYWSSSGESLLGSLDSEKTLVEQLHEKSFAHPFSPNWQDASTQKECDSFDEFLGSEDELARITGSKAHHVKHLYPGLYISANTYPSASRAPKSCGSTNSVRKSTVQRPVSRWSRLSWPLYFSAESLPWISAMHAA